MATLKAKKIQGYLVEPLRDGYSLTWEGFITTNPSAIRLTGDPRVFLAYRAGGDSDMHFWNEVQVWGSNMGMAILDERGCKVTHRLPLPLMKHFPNVPIPTTPDMFRSYVEKHPNEMLVMHDFRLQEFNKHIYVIFHIGGVSKVHDCIVRMRTEDFLHRINQSIALMGPPPETLLERWHALWWAADVWEPCGFDGTNRLFPSDVQKGDIVFYPLSGGMQMCHRPMPDMAVIDTDTDFFASATPDGITRWGALEQCVRAGMTDNSHIGANGGPTLVRIGQTNVFIDVPHGVHNRAVSDPACDRMALRYFAYFRVKDALTGAPLYYSEEPILDHDALWREYVEEGAWVSRLDHLDGVMFAGGHVPVDPDKCSENDLFCLYTGVGDTAVARAEFRIRDLLPECALEDIRRLDQFKQQRLKTVSPLRIHFPAEASGWQWYADNDIDKRAISITRLLDRNGYHEVECSFVYPRPGYFDSVMTTLATESIEMFDDLGWLVAYRGVRWDTEEGKQVTRVGFGFLLLEPDNPQRIIFRSGSSLVPPAVLDGWVAGTEILPPSQMLDKPLDHIPERVVAEIRRTRECAQKGIAFSTQFTDWLKKKAAFWNPTR